jgi:hypothetical protein
MIKSGYLTGQNVKVLYTKPVKVMGFLRDRLPEWGELDGLHVQVEANDGRKQGYYISQNLDGRIVSEFIDTEDLIPQ